VKKIAKIGRHLRKVLPFSTGGPVIMTHRVVVYAKSSFSNPFWSKRDLFTEITQSQHHWKNHTKNVTTVAHTASNLLSATATTSMTVRTTTPLLKWRHFGWWRTKFICATSTVRNLIHTHKLVHHSSTVSTDSSTSLLLMTQS